MIRTFVKEDYEALKPYEEHLVRAKYGKYIYALRRTAFEEMYAVYRSLGYTQRLDYSCNSCLLQLCITLGNYYFDFKDKMKKEPEKNVKRKVGEYNANGELLREFESVTKAVEETGVSKGNMYKSLKDGTAVDEKVYKYIE